MKYFLVLVLYSVTFSLMSQELRSEKAQALAKELKYSVNQTVAKILEYEKQAGSEDVSHFTLQQEPASESSLGLVLSPDSEVILVSPTSPAEKLGLEPGDVIDSLFFNDKQLNLKQINVLKEDGTLTAKIKRDNKWLTLSKQIQLETHLGWRLSLFETNDEAEGEFLETEVEGCGQISIFFKPPETREIYPAFINKIDGDSVLRSRETFNLAAGSHTISVHELIPLREIRYRKRSLAKSKDITINIEPNKAYYIGAKFFRNKRFQQRNEDYWEPVVWKIADRKCSL